MYRTFSTVISAVVWVLLPKCSLCLVAYASVFSALGLGSLVQNKFTLPLIIALLAVNVLSVVYLSVLKKEYGYALVSVGGAVIFIVNKIYMGPMLVNVVTGLVLLIAMLRVRFFRLKRKDCVFSDEKETLCV